MLSALVWLAASSLGCSEPDSVEIANDSSAPVFSVFGSGAKTGIDETLSRSDADDRDPVVESVSLDPQNPMTRELIRATARVSGTWTSVRYEWSVNGEAFGGNSLEVALPTIKTGDTVSVRVVPIRGQVEGESMAVNLVAKNQRPMLRSLRMERAEAGEVGFGFSGASDGEIWRAIVRAEDPDGDPLRFQYRWYVNGERSDIDDEFFPTGDLTRRGDRIELEVRVFDGEVWSDASRTGKVEIGNSPPSIVSTPPRVDARGQFRYQLRVEDPDGDTQFRYSLKQAPRGMQLDEVNGVVRWEPDSDQAGRHTIEIAVSDEGGAESTQSFSLALVTQSDGAAPGPAASR